MPPRYDAPLPAAVRTSLRGTSRPAPSSVAGERRTADPTRHPRRVSPARSQAGEHRGVSATLRPPAGREDQRHLGLGRAGVRPAPERRPTWSRRRNVVAKGRVGHPTDQRQHEGPPPRAALRYVGIGTALPGRRVSAPRGAVRWPAAAFAPSPARGSPAPARPGCPDVERGPVRGASHGAGGGRGGRRCRAGSGHPDPRAGRSSRPSRRPGGGRLAGSSRSPGFQAWGRTCVRQGTPPGGRKSTNACSGGEYRPETA